MPTAQSNVEKYLAVIAGHDEEIPTQPGSRVEWYLNEILQNGGGGGGGGSSLKVRIVATLPTAGVSGVLYLVPSGKGSGTNLYDEYVWVEDETKFELLGQTGINVDLTDYAKKSEIPKKTSALTNDSGFLTEHQSLSDYATKSEIPTKTSQLTNNSGFLTEHQSLANYVTKTDQSASDAAQNSRISDNETAIAALIAYLQSMEVYRTASGNPVSFSDGYANAALKSCVVTITPTLSGTPSVENPVPIPGYASVTVTRSGENGVDPQTAAVTLTDGTNPLTVYGGTLDLLTGELTVTHGHSHVDANTDAAWNSSIGGALLKLGFSRVPNGPIGICSAFPTRKITSWTNSIAGYLNVYGGNSASSLGSAMLVIEGVDSEEAYRTWIADPAHEFDYVAPLGTPVTYQLTPVSLTSLSGYNSVSADAGTLAVTYRADTSSISLGG